MRALVGRAARKHLVVSRAELLPLATRQPVLALGPDRHLGYVGNPGGGPAGTSTLPSGTDVCHLPACGGRFGACVSHPPRRAGTGPITQAAVCHPLRSTARGRAGL